MYFRLIQWYRFAPLWQRFLFLAFCTLALVAAVGTGVLFLNSAVPG